MNLPASPFDISPWIYLFILVVGFVGGLVNYLSRGGKNGPGSFSLRDFLGDLIGSGLTALLAFWFCVSQDLSPYITAVLVGISGHLSTRLLFIVDDIAMQWLKKIAKRVEIQDRIERTLPTFGRRSGRQPTKRDPE